jgi:twitching motility protein PilT
MNGGRVPAVEVMVPNAAIKNLIREDKIHQIYSQMQVGQGASGMQTMNQALLQLYQRRQISLDVAYEHASDVDELRMMVEGRGSGVRPPSPQGRF